LRSIDNRAASYLLQIYLSRQQLTETKAIQIAAEYAKERGWPWLEPIVCHRHIPLSADASYLILTNADKRGANIRITVDPLGIVTDAKFLPR
jgi:hypothetical protein